MNQPANVPAIYPVSLLLRPKETNELSLSSIKHYKVISNKPFLCIRYIAKQQVEKLNGHMHYSPKEFDPRCAFFFRNEIAGFKFSREILEPKIGTVLQRSSLQQLTAKHMVPSMKATSVLRCVQPISMQSSIESTLPIFWKTPEWSPIFNVTLYSMGVASQEWVTWIEGALVEESATIIAVLNLLKYKERCISLDYYGAFRGQQRWFLRFVCDLEPWSCRFKCP